MTYVIVVSHVHPTIEHDVFAPDRDKDATTTNILTSSSERKGKAGQLSWDFHVFLRQMVYMYF